MASLGDQFLQPEVGYKRKEIEEIPSIKMNGFAVYSRNYGHGGKIIWDSGNTKGQSVEFSLNCSSFRVLGPLATDGGTGNIYVDDVLIEENVVFSGSDVPTSQVSNPYCKLQYQLDFDDEKERKIKIESNGVGYLYLDTIDYVSDSKIGEQLPQPEEGWRRYDDNDSLIIYKNGISQTESRCYKGSYTYIKAEPNNSARFNFIGTKIRLIGAFGTTEYRANKVNVYIDGEFVEEFSQISGQSIFQAIMFEKQGLDKRVHEVEFIGVQENGQTDSASRVIIDAFDIDDDGFLVPELSRDYEFPIAVIEEEEIEGYAGSLINGEEQLLITPTGKLFLTNGNKGFITVGGEVDLSAYYNKEEIDKLIADNLHEHANKDIIDSLGDSANMLTYKGKVVVNNNEYSFRSLPRAKVVENYSTSKGGKLPWLS